LRTAFAELPLFPLQEVVLFPGMLLPLHVFEPRYVELVRDVLGTHRCFSVVHVAERDADMLGHPEIARVAGVGTIVEHGELPGSRYHLVLLGRARVTLDELPFRAPYRRAVAKLLPSEGGAADLELAAMHAAVSGFVQLVKKSDADFRLRLPRDAPPGIVADACAHQLVLDARDRQRLLETVDISKRIQALIEILTVQKATIGTERDALN
jgi:ATP-dependent Lon protease